MKVLQTCKVVIVRIIYKGGVRKDLGLVKVFQFIYFTLNVVQVFRTHPQ